MPTAIGGQIITSLTIESCVFAGCCPRNAFDPPAAFPVRALPPLMVTSSAEVAEWLAGASTWPDVEP